MKTIGILLAGGQSRRYGSPKAFAVLEGKYFYERAYEALTAVSDHVVVVSRPELISDFRAGMDVITDLPSVAGKGPLAGIYTAMSERPAECYVVLPCDMPYIGQKELTVFMQLSNNAADITAVRTDSERIPLFSRWNGNMKELLERELDDGQLGVMSFLKKVTTDWMDASRIHPDKHIFRNINTSD
ncbi:molybdenum cofactor guanylyltransferase [Planococcus salinus]|uniref:Probable molybdenum cofactor guanylyltransferase n=1 Tax=Planococcus salinus TaxID=1848460 RepID=A0A3M8PE88_9BACL|nr:molybdenum cofactor guanylyltransferase [Planococcus salinus]RNF41160.1 molybdenum cofactor guanylyltransferase [Planococcus salinus]